MPSEQRPLWTCPKCQHRFVTPNMWHSCSNYTLDHHFAGKPPIIRETFERLLFLVKDCGPATVIPQKTRISIQVRVRFAGGVPRKDWFDAALWLRRRAKHPQLRRVEVFGPNSFGHHFRFMKPEELDAAFAKLVREAYAVGCQENPSKGRNE